MTTVTILDPTRATEAGWWCNENLKPEDWSLRGHHLFTKSPTYYFKFRNSEQAMIFALKWI